MKFGEDGKSTGNLLALEARHQKGFTHTGARLNL